MSTASSPLDGDAPSPELTEDAPTAVDDADQFFDQDAEPTSGGGDTDDDADPRVAADPETDQVDDADEIDDTDEPDEADEPEELGDELDAELEAEAAGMAPLVELPDRAAFAGDAHHTAPAARPVVTEQHTASGDLLTVRVRGHGRVPARKVRRVIRRIDPLSVLKLSFFFNVCLFAMFLIAGLLLWSAAVGSGSTDNIESFVIDIGFEDFKLVGADLFRGFVVFGGGLVIAGTVFAVLLALLFNLISDIVGGIRFTVIEPMPVPDDAGADDV